MYTIHIYMSMPHMNGIGSEDFTCHIIENACRNLYRDVPKYSSLQLDMQKYSWDIAITCRFKKELWFNGILMFQMISPTGCG